MAGRDELAIKLQLSESWIPKNCDSARNGVRGLRTVLRNTNLDLAGPCPDRIQQSRRARMEGGAFLLLQASFRVPGRAGHHRAQIKKPARKLRQRKKYDGLVLRQDRLSPVIVIS